MRRTRQWSAAVTVIALLSLLLTAAAAAQSPEPAGGTPVLLPFVMGGASGSPAQEQQPADPAPADPAPADPAPADPAPVEQPSAQDPPEPEPEPVPPGPEPSEPGLVEPEPEEPVVVDNPDAAQWDVTDAAVASPLGTEAVDWNIVGNFTVSNNLGVGREPPALLGDFYRSLNSAQQVRVTNTSAGGSASAALAAVTNIGGVILEVYGNGHTQVWDGINVRNWARLAVGSTLNGLIVTTNANDPLIFGTNGQERIRIEGGGDVGIGTTNPNFQLTVEDSSSVNVLRLIGPGVNGSTARMNFGDGTSVYISEAADNDLIIRATDEINLSTNRLELNSVQPVRIIRLENINNQRNTNLPDATWDCVVTSWNARHDIQENDTGDQWMWAFVSGGTWWVRSNLRSHNNEDLPDVDLLCFLDDMVTWSGASRALVDAD